MKRIMLVLTGLVVVLLGLSFSVINAEPVSLNYYYGQTDIPLSIIIVLAIVIGALLGIFTSLSLVVKAKSELKKLRKEIKLKEQEIVNLRAIPMKDSH